MDVHTKKQRSYNMSRIRSKNTNPEKLLFNLLRSNGIVFSKHGNLLGKPDAVIKKYRIAIFVDGEFWHGKSFISWSDKLQPFWQKKIIGNIKRDRDVNRGLRSKGWHVLRIWAEDVNKKPNICISKIMRYIVTK